MTFRTEAGRALYRRGVSSEGGIGTAGWLNQLGSAIREIEAEAAADDLGAAWAAAEMALPEHDFGISRTGDGLFGAWARHPVASMHEFAENANTPAAALRALTARLEADHA